MVNKVFYISYLYYGESWSISYVICPTCIKDNHGQYGLLYVLLILRTVMANKVF